MTGAELLAVVAGLAAGYWLVSKLLARNERAGKTPAPHAPAQERAGMAPPWHHVLELSPDASAEDIHAAYRRLMDQAHPDKATADELTVAYEQAMRLRDDQSAR